MPSVTMTDVARASGVSVMTVSNVINNRPRVGADTRARVLGVIDELGYEVNLSAKRLRAGRTSTVGLVVPSLGHPYFGELADRYVTAFARRGIHVAIEQSGASKEGELSAISRARLQMYDGVLLSVVGLSYEDVDRIRRRYRSSCSGSKRPLPVSITSCSPTPRGRASRPATCSTAGGGALLSSAATAGQRR
jgi:DNA-binding LacI/PurR family transcriptional regulator